jgi:uncharacterized membrane protein
MTDRSPPPSRVWPTLGCLTLALAVLFLCLMPLVLVETMQAALERLHLSPQVALAAVVAIFVGGLVNVPVYRIRREQLQPVEMIAVFGAWGWVPYFRRVRQDTIIAVNVGGCLIPVALAGWQVFHMVRESGWPLGALGIVVAANVLVCYFAARPVQGVGIVMPGLLSPVVALTLTWLLLPAEFQGLRAPVAFVAGVLGPLVGADLLHLRDIARVSTGLLSIGGAGTFDGIVLSGVLAAFLA